MRICVNFSTVYNDTLVAKGFTWKLSFTNDFSWRIWFWIVHMIHSLNFVMQFFQAGRQRSNRVSWPNEISVTNISWNGRVWSISRYIKMLLTFAFFKDLAGKNNYWSEMWKREGLILKCWLQGSVAPPQIYSVLLLILTTPETSSVRKNSLNWHSKLINLYGSLEMTFRIK